MKWPDVRKVSPWIWDQGNGLWFSNQWQLGVELKSGTLHAFFTRLAYRFDAHDRRRSARLNWCVDFSTNPLGAACVVGRTGGKILGKFMIIPSQEKYDRRLVHMNRFFFANESSNLTAPNPHCMGPCTAGTKNGTLPEIVQKTIFQSKDAY